MTSVDAASAELAGSGVVVREVTEGCPWPGAVVRDVDGVPTLHVDADVLAQWQGWSADPAGHVLTAIDVVRTGKGHRVVLPLCATTLAGVLDDHESAAQPFSPGAVVTMAVSILRGLGEAVALGATTGQWWLTEEARPVLALGVGDEDIGDTSRALLERLSEACTGDLARALRRASEACAECRSAPEGIEWQSCETALFDAADAAPIEVRVYAPALARTIATATRPATDPAPPRRSQRRLRPDSSTASVAAQVESLVAAEIPTDAVHGALSWARSALASRRGRGSPGPRSDVHRRRRRRGRPLIVAAGLGALVLAGGALWPVEEKSFADPTISPTASSPVSATSTAAPTAMAPTEPVGAEVPAEPVEVDVVATAERLLIAWEDCATRDDAACRSELLEDPDRRSADALAIAPTEPRVLTLVDDYGGVAVLRITAAESGESVDQLLVIVEVERKWLIRDVYDVADQP